MDGRAEERRDRFDVPAGPHDAHHLGHGLREIDRALGVGKARPVAARTLRTPFVPKPIEVAGHARGQPMGGHLQLQLQRLVPFVGIERKAFGIDDLPGIEIGIDSMATDAPLAPPLEDGAHGWYGPRPSGSGDGWKFAAWRR